MVEFFGIIQASPIFVKTFSWFSAEITRGGFVPVSIAPQLFCSFMLCVGPAEIAGLGSGITAR